MLCGKSSICFTTMQKIGLQILINRRGCVLVIWTLLLRPSAEDAQKAQICF